MVTKRLKARPTEYCSYLVGLLEKNDTRQFANDFLSGITGKHHVSILFVLEQTGVSIIQLAGYLVIAGIGYQKVQQDCPDTDTYKPALVAALHELQERSKPSRSDRPRGFGARGERIRPIMPPRNEAKRPYVLTMAFRNEVAHSC